MKFGIPSASGSADRLDSFFKAPIPSGCTLIQVESRLTTFTLVWIMPLLLDLCEHTLETDKGEYHASGDREAKEQSEEDEDGNDHRVISFDSGPVQ